MLKQKTESMEQEIQEMRNHIEMFKQHIIGIKGALTPGYIYLLILKDPIENYKQNQRRGTRIINNQQMKSIK